MRRLLFLITACLATMPSWAQLDGDGYYRVKNKTTGRYILVIDNKVGEVDISTAKPDLSSLATLKPFSNVVSDPASIIYIQKNGAGYILKGQGSDSYQITGYNLYIDDMYDGTYMASGSAKGITVILSDEKGSDDDGILMTTGSTTRNWYIEPVEDAPERYFALTPEFSIGNDYYLSFYASFPIQLQASQEAFYVDSYYATGSKGAARLTKLTGKQVPAESPVIIRCASPLPEDNKVTILDSNPAASKSNRLKGVYFCCLLEDHTSRTAYSTSTMRVLGTTSDGSIGLVRAKASYLTSGKYLPANKAFFEAATLPAELKLLEGDDYTEYLNYLTGIESPVADAPASSGTFTLSGVRVADGAPLAPGVYIVNGKKTVVK